MADLPFTLDRFAQYLLQSTTWVFLTVVLIVCHQALDWMPRPGWSDYGALLAVTCLLALPVILFSIYRKTLREKLPAAGYRVLWAIVFGGVPAVFYGGEMIERFSLPATGDEYALIVGFGLLLAELAVIAGDFISRRIRSTAWMNRIGLEQGIVLVLALAAFLIAVTEVFIDVVYEDRPYFFTRFPASLLTFIFHGLQYYIILLLYYTFYLVNHYFLVSKLLRYKGIVYYLFGLAGTLLLLYPFAAEIISWLPVVWRGEAHPAANGQVFDDINLIIPLFGLLLSIPFIFMVQWYQRGNAIIRLEKHHAEAELHLLKQQIDPHFFFNTLNNLYALSLTQDRATPEVILKLSELMRYVIYQGKNPYVPLIEEIGYIEDYVELQRIRQHQQLDYRFDVRIDDEQLPVPPLLFINFVENAFKHGIEPASGPGFLYLSLTQENGRLEFSCRNSVEEVTAGKPGIGLDNLKRRLALLAPGKYQMTCRREAKTYRAVLQLHLS
jgi:hypothetical protein